VITKPTQEIGASEEIVDAYGTRYLRDAGTGQLHRIGPRAIKRPARLFDVNQAIKAVDAVIAISGMEVNETKNNIPAEPQQCDSGVR
jgi:hypothetical protein